MKKIFTILILGVSLQVFAQGGTRKDVNQVIFGSQVMRTIDVIINDNGDVNRTYTLDTFYYSATSTPPNISVTKSGNSLNFRDIQGTLSNDTVFYIAKDQFNVRDTNILVITKANLSLDLYPGDCNRDNICNNIDVLNIGIGYGKTDQIREGIYFTDNWGPVRAYDWTQFSAKSNYRFADANGNGSIDSASDISVIFKNYGTVANTPSVTYSPAGGQIFSINAADTFALVAGNTSFQIKLQLGSSAATASYSYGLAFTLKYDTTIFKSNFIQFNPSKWFTDLHNTLNFARVNATKGEVDLAIVRRDGSNKNGFGELGVIDVVVDDILGGLTNGMNVNFEITKAVIIDSFYNLLPVTLPNPKPVHVVKKSSSSIAAVTPKSIIISQDQDKLYVHNTDLKKSELTIYNLLGTKVIKSRDWDGQKMTIDIKTWSPGLYLIQYRDQVKKVQIY
jgi:hypothetical protein